MSLFSRLPIQASGHVSKQKSVTSIDGNQKMFSTVLFDKS